MSAPTFADWLDLMPLVADRGWRVDARGFIRDGDERCPLCALAHELSAGQADFRILYTDALDALGAGVDLNSTKVINAADLPGNDDRRALMQALGMVTP